MKTARIAVAVSGGGRTLENLIAVQQAGDAAFQISSVLSSRPDCRGVSIAQGAGLPVFCHKFPVNPDAALETDLTRFLHDHQTDWIVLAGFLRPLPILAPWRDRIINIHPALLPKFGGKGMYGMNVHRAVIEAREEFSGATVHFVNEHYDEGAVIAQISVSVKRDDDAQRLADRVFAAESKLYPEVINKLITGELPLGGGKIFKRQAD